MDIINREPTLPNQNPNTHDPVKVACTDHTLRLKEYGAKVLGGQKYQWWIKGIEAYWEFLTNRHLKAYKGTAFSWDEHTHLIELAATAGWGTKDGELTLQQFLDELAGIVRPTKEE